MDLFLRGEIPFPGIPRIVKTALDQMTLIEEPTLQELMEADRWAREEALSCRC